jgi:hypothetical protein
MDTELRTAIQANEATLGISEAGDRVIVTLASAASATTRQVTKQLTTRFARGMEGYAPPQPPLNPSPQSAAAQVSSTAPVARASLKGKVAVAEVPSVGIQPNSCGPETCGLPLRAGVHIEDAAGGCSAGFITTWWSGERSYFFILAAGHCIRGGEQYSWDSSPYPSSTPTWIGSHWAWKDGTCCGEPAWEMPAESLDDAEINMNWASYWTNVIAPGPLWVHGWPGNTEWEIHGEERPYVGQWSCRSGYKTTYTCGTVVALDDVGLEPGTEVGNLMIIEGMCATEGDSGGPIWGNGPALGIVVGGWNGNSCIQAATKVTDANHWFGTTIYG